MQQDRLIATAQKNRRTGIFLTFLVIGLFLYSFLIIRHRGQTAEPTNLTTLQKIWRGL